MGGRRAATAAATADSCTNSEYVMMMNAGPAAGAEPGPAPALGGGSCSGPTSLRPLITATLDVGSVGAHFSIYASTPPKSKSAKLGVKSCALL